MKKGSVVASLDATLLLRKRFIERLNPPGPSEKVGCFLANITLTGAELDRQTFARDALTFEIDAELVARIGENGHEVLIDDEDEGGGRRGRRLGVLPDHVALKTYHIGFPGSGWPLPSCGVYPVEGCVGMTG